MAPLTDGERSILQRKAHRLVRCWGVTPLGIDAAVLAPVYVTDHNKPISILGITYTPQGGVNSSAMAKVADFTSSNVELRGALRTDRFSEQALEAGLWVGALINTFVVDWRFPFVKVRETNLRLQETELDGDSWTAQAVTLGALLRRPVGQILNRDCPYELGDADCRVDTAAITDTGAVTAIDEERLIFQTNLSSKPDNYYQYGFLTWTSGANKGAKARIKSSTQTNSVLSFQLESNLAIAVADTFSIIPGCGQLPEWCKGTDGDKDRPWANNIDNHGGHPTISGADQQVRAPSR